MKKKQRAISHMEWTPITILFGFSQFDQTKPSREGKLELHLKDH